MSNIPLSWEMLTLVGTVGAAALAGGWALGRASSQGVVQALRAHNEFLRVRLSVLETEVNNGKVAQNHSHERIMELTERYGKLIAEFKSLASARPADTEASQRLQLVDQLQTQLQRYDRLRGSLGGSEDDVWNLLESRPPHDFERRMLESRLVALVVANLKGGVGKTTLVANLAAYFAKKLKKRVLVIDFDYQGSLTRMILPGAGLELGKAVLADELIGGRVDGSWVVEKALKLGDTLPAAHLVTCGSTFEGVEFRVMVRGLLGDADDDVRYRLANLLLSTDVQRAFDIVIIDAPPRSSAGALNGLFASHGLLIPTILDDISVDAVAHFIQRAKRYRRFNPALGHVGVVGSLTEHSKLTPNEKAAHDAARSTLVDWGRNAHMLQTNIRHFRALAQSAGKSIGYLENRDVRAAFDELGAEIVEKFELAEKLNL